ALLTIEPLPSHMSSHELNFDDRRLVGDVDGDGITDFADVMRASHLVRVWSGRDGHVLHSWTEEGDASDTFTLGDIGDIDLDGRADLCIRRAIRNAAVGDEITNEVRIYSGRDRSSIATIQGSEGGFGAQVANIGDVDGDGRPELL